MEIIRRTGRSQGNRQEFWWPEITPRDASRLRLCMVGQRDAYSVAMLANRCQGDARSAANQSAARSVADRIQAYRNAILPLLRLRGDFPLIEKQVGNSIRGEGVVFRFDVTMDLKSFPD